MDDLNLSRLRAFLLVTEELNFTRAAARLHVAQQALSATIRRLERDVGVQLFDRTTRAVQLTPAGAALEMISAGRAVAISAAGWTRFYPRPGVRSLPVAGLARSEVALAWRKGDTNPLVRRFVDLALAATKANPSLLRAIEKPA
jgi:DNA-binding transcriptional LysR family regulator